jgi:arginase family enzyme
MGERRPGDQLTHAAPGRLTSRELLRVLRGLTNVNLVGADVAAATVVYDLITLMARQD